jgi:hypothetical protein
MMKDKIRQILREETSEFDPKMLNALYQYMNHLTKDYVWYYDTPKQRFKYTPETIWLINPKTEKWAIVLQKGGNLWWYNDLYTNFQRYFNMERPDFESFITIWVEDVLNRGVSSTLFKIYPFQSTVEDVLNRGVSSTAGVSNPAPHKVEDVLKNGEELK